MKPIILKPNEFRLVNFIEYMNDNIEELLYDYENEIKKVILIDKDYQDVVLDEEAYEDLEDSQMYKELLLNEEYNLLISVAKTNENLDRLEFINGEKYSLNHYLGDEYQEKTIKDIGDLSLDMSHLIGLLVDFYDNEIVLSLVNFEYGDQISTPRIIEVEESGDFEEIIQNLVYKFI